MLKKKKKLKCYDVAFDSDVYCISLVQDPAIEVNYVALSKEKPLQILLEKEDKHIIVGCALVPDKPIYRRDGDEEFYILFSNLSVGFIFFIPQVRNSCFFYYFQSHQSK